MKYVNYHAKPVRPLWKAVTYETLRLIGMLIFFGALMLFVVWVRKH
jgi:hypothetical protein